VLLRVVTALFKHLPSTGQKYALLWIHDFCFCTAVAKKVGIELRHVLIDVVQRNVIVAVARGHFGVQNVASGAKHRFECRNAVHAGVPAVHANNGNIAFTVSH